MIVPPFGSMSESDSCSFAQYCGNSVIPGCNLLGRRMISWYRPLVLFLTVAERALSQQITEVRVSTLGSFRVYLDDKRLELKHEASRKVMAMLLLSDEQICLRRTVAETIWPDTPRSKSLGSLRQTILALSLIHI